MSPANFLSILNGYAIWREGRWVQALRSWGVFATAALLRLKALAPYALIEVILPGGSVMALLLWLYRRRRSERRPRSGYRGLDSIAAMNPDPNTLMAANAKDCTGEALFSSQTLHRKSVRTENATLAAHATMIPSCLNNLMMSLLRWRNPAPFDDRRLPDATVSIGRD